ncbi:MAG: hypothetical protein HC811_09270 [Flammeovirgaceae bacterium]|nr:hypothetical protein [Flammeovirgaceae bacterium]
MTRYLYHILILILLSLGSVGTYAESASPTANQTTEESAPKPIEESVLWKNEKRESQRQPSSYQKHNLAHLYVEIQETRTRFFPSFPTLFIKHRTLLL